MPVFTPTVLTSCCFQYFVDAAQGVSVRFPLSLAAMDHIVLEVWLDHSTPYLHARERLSLCQVARLPDAFQKEARASYRRAMSDVIQLLAPLHGEKRFIPGLNEASRATDIHFADCDEREYTDNISCVWGTETYIAFDFEEWVQASDVEADSFARILSELNPDESIILFELVEWLDCYIQSVIWFPEDWQTGEPATTIIIFNNGDVEGSVCWSEQFVDPVGYYL